MFIQSTPLKGENSAYLQPGDVSDNEVWQHLYSHFSSELSAVSEVYHRALIGCCFLLTSAVL